jgi:hypothetical protein
VGELSIFCPLRNQRLSTGGDFLLGLRHAILT